MIDWLKVEDWYNTDLTEKVNLYFYGNSLITQAEYDKQMKSVEPTTDSALTTN